MTLQEAIRSGKKFRRPHFYYWIYRDNLNFYTSDHSRDKYVFDAESIVADDWEVEEEKRSFSFKEIRDAVINSIKHTSTGFGRVEAGVCYTTLRDLLGFEE